ncbi:alpha-1,2-Mannosidase [Mycena kentingensis (nom. inval.)]|nr:alpha-1,2-Mannosidase [Mycena kentingensis (nom. inval.)]
MRLSVAFVLGLFASASAAGIKVQKKGLKVPSRYKHRSNDVKKIFTTSYNAYKEFAWGHDDLSPVSKGFNDGRNGFLGRNHRRRSSDFSLEVTLLYMCHYASALTTSQEDFLAAVNFTSQIDFSRSKTSDTVSVFETTIRYLGGLLSAYELSDKKHPILLEKAKEVADKMMYAWVGDNDVPYGFMDFATNTPQIGTSNIAEAGTLSLEGFILSKHSDNATYGSNTAKSAIHIANLPAPLPGLAAQGIDPTTGEFVGGYVTWGGGSDSYFEYLIKYARLTNTDDSTFIDAWKTAVDSSIQYLLRRSTVGNHLYLADFDSSRRIRHVGSHLACFHAGNWLLGGKLLQNQTIIDIALELNEACWNTYVGTATGIGPESFAFISDDGNFTGSDITAEQIEFYNEHGFYITSPFYILRPEVLESNFHAWRVTGDTKYLDRAGDAIDAFNKVLPSTVGYAALNNVNDASQGQIDDTQRQALPLFVQQRILRAGSFWFAEVLKYLHLTFDSPETISLDEWVFNTEAQPFRAPPALSSYSGKVRPPAQKPFTVQSGDLPAVSPYASVPASTPE